MRAHIGRISACIGLVLIMLAGACTSSGEEGGGSLTASDAASSFVNSWNSGDYESLVAAIDDASGKVWTPEQLQRWIERKLAAGAVTSLEASVDEGAEPDGEATDSATFPFTLTYESDAAAEPVTLSGTVDLEYDDTGDRWLVQWSRDILWPGLEGAARFSVATKWPRRAAILDRSGRPMARGPVGNRSYPFGSVGGSLVGHVETVTKADARDRDDGAKAGDIVGGSGLEQGLNERLGGRPATNLQVRDSNGEVLEVLGRAPGERARPVRTTIDVDVQRGAESAFGDTTGGVAVIDPRTGDLLAAVGSGPFDPNNYVGATGVDPFNRAIAGRYPPGSSMKVVTAAAALDTGVVTPTTLVSGPQEYKGVRNFESGEFGEIPFASATQFSVNTAYAQVAEKLGARRLSRYAQAFGFNQSPEVPIELLESSFPDPVGLSDLMWASIGQAQVLATPVQMATVAATIAKSGKRMDLRVTMDDRPTGERVVSRRTAGQVTSMMENVVVGGTGSAARVSGLRIAGKTGTAEVDVDGERMNHAWFIAFAPVEAPRVAVAVVSELGGIGGQVAAPLARQVLINVLPHIE
jgi:Penicillin binding protein transpeptidase domain/Penicillin-binding Protein dimerisation domain/NTF2-like N-terminal transpeptidase domain